MVSISIPPPQTAGSATLEELQSLYRRRKAVDDLIASLERYQRTSAPLLVRKRITAAALREREELAS